MISYKLSPLADAQQDQIWRYTESMWGEHQAISYIEGLHACFDKLSRTRALWRKLPHDLVVPSDIRTAVYFSRYREHLIFFRSLPSGAIGILSVLHGRSDLPVRLSEDLFLLSGDGGFDEE